MIAEDTKQTKKGPFQSLFNLIMFYKTRDGGA